MPLLWLAVTALAAPLALALAGLDFFAYRNLLAVWVLLAVVAAAALGTRTRQGGALAACGLGVIFLALTISVNLTPSLQRADWRYSPTALGQPPWPRLIVITPNFEADPFRIYDPSAQFSTVRRVAVREIDLVGYRIPPRGHPPRLGHGFRLADRVDHQRLSFVRYIAPRTTSLDLRSIRGLTREPRSWLLEPAS
jgi:hypothetical protein